MIKELQLVTSFVPSTATTTPTVTTNHTTDDSSTHNILTYTLMAEHIHIHTNTNSSLPRLHNFLASEYAKDGNP